MAHAGIRRTAVTTVAIAAVALLGGCSLLTGGDDALRPPQRRSASASASPSSDARGAAPDGAGVTGSATPRPATAPPEPTSAPSPTIAPLAAGTVVEEHEVDSPKGSIHYHLRILADGGDRFTAEFSGFTSSVPVPVSATLMAHAPSVGDGITDHGSGDLQLGGPTSGVAATSSSTIDIGARPTQLGVLVTYSSAPTADGVPVELGPGKVLAVDPITWQIPARTTNVHPVDSPARPFAYGIVYETTASGAPKLYRIAHGDTTPEVAKRFGISVEDLLWLNPNLEVFGNQEYLYEGTVLNLDPEILRKH